MPTTTGYTIPERLDRGRRWLEFWQLKSDVRESAARMLNDRGYGVPVPPGKEDSADKPGKGAAPHKEPTEHQRGIALFDAFALSQGSQTLAGSDRAVHTSAEDIAEAALRKWVRGVHAEIVAIRREETAPVLATLQTLGELGTQPGLNASADAMLGFLGKKDVLAALVKYHIGEGERADGKKRYDAWWAARGSSSGARSGLGSATQEKRVALDAFDAWLNKWWGIACVRLEDMPAVLTALGVESKKRASSSATADDAGDASAPEPQGDEMAG